MATEGTSDGREHTCARARAADRSCRTACIIANREARVGPFPFQRYRIPHPWVHLPPLVPRSMCVGRSGLPCTSRESPSPPPLLLTTQQTTATSRQSPLKILLRTHVRIRIHVSALDAAAVSRYFCEKKNLFLEKKERERGRRRREPRRTILFHVARAWKRKWGGGLRREGGWKKRKSKRERETQWERWRGGDRHDWQLVVSVASSIRGHVAFALPGFESPENPKEIEGKERETEGKGKKFNVLVRREHEFLYEPAGLLA